MSAGAGRWESPKPVSPLRIRGSVGALQLHTTPGILRIGCAAALVGITALWTVGAVAIRDRHDTAREIEAHAAPRLVAAEQLYVALADADATASRAFLHGGQAPLADRDRYESDLATAARRLTALGDDSGRAHTTRAALADINTRLTEYASRVEAARANSAQGFPVGASYLREASRVMREEILPNATVIYRDTSDRLSEDYAAGTSGADVVAIALLGAVIVVVLVVVQLFLFRRTNRILNPMLLAATVLVAVIVTGSVVWLGTGQSAIARAQHKGTDAIGLLATSRILTLRTQAASTLAVIQRQDDGVAAESTHVLGGEDGRGGALAHVAGVLGVDSRAMDILRTRFSEFRGIVESVQGHVSARELVPATETALGAQSAATDRLDRALLAAIATAHDRFESAARDARANFATAVILLSVMTAISAALIVFGVRPRLAEYR